MGMQGGAEGWGEVVSVGLCGQEGRGGSVFEIRWCGLREAFEVLAELVWGWSSVEALLVGGYEDGDEKEGEQDEEDG